MNAMIDAQCDKCHRRFGWCGTMASRPACPGCGDRPPQGELDASAAKHDAMIQRWLTHPSRADCETRQKQRVDSGLSLRQAAKMLNVTPSHLSDTENGRAEPSKELLDAMGRLYDCGTPDEINAGK